MTRLFNAIIASLLISTSFGHVMKRSEEDGLGDEHEAGIHFHWDYNGLEGAPLWGSFESTCDTGLIQTPINFEPTSSDALKINLAYANSDGAQPSVSWADNQEGTIKNLGDTIKFETKNPALSTFTRLGAKNPLNLLQFHIHTPSEHRLDNLYYPAEIHFVHVDNATSPSVLAVVGAFIEIGPTSDAFLSNFINFAAKNLPKKGQSSTEYKPVYSSIASIIKSSPVLYRYTGSLTTPPCTEGVKWLVADSASKLRISPQDYQFLRSLIGFNSRETRPLRTLYDDKWAERRVSDFKIDANSNF